MKKHTVTRNLLWTLAVALSFASAGHPAESVPPGVTDVALLRTVSTRLQAPERAREMPVSVATALRSMSGEIVKQFDGPEGARYSRVTIRVRTRHAAWNPGFDQGPERRVDSEGAVGLYVWQWEVAPKRTRAGRELVVTASNLLMLDPAYVQENEGDALGRMINEALLYHELLHGQLLLNAMDDPEWRGRLARTGRFEADARDQGHAIIGGLERSFLLRRAGKMGYTVGAMAEGDTFTLRAASLPRGYSGPVAVRFRTTADSNVKDLTMDLPRGRQRGTVLLRGRLIDPSRSGYFLALIETGATARRTAPEPTG